MKSAATATLRGNKSAMWLPVPTAKGEFWLAILLFGVVAAVFLPSIRNDFLYWFGDDPRYVTENPHVLTGLKPANLLWSLSSTERGSWFPVTWISHMLDCQLYGLKPWGHHLTSVLLHAVNVVLLLYVLRHLTERFWRSFIVATFFGLHPLRVESVSWVAERKDVLSVFFFLLALASYVQFVRLLKTEPRRSKLFYGLTLVSFACCLMSKSMLVTAPFVLLLLDYWPLQRWQKKNVPALLLEKVPLLLLSVSSSLIEYSTARGWGFVNETNPVPLLNRLQNVVVAYARYLTKICWPTDLCAFYLQPDHWPLATVLAAGSVLTAVTALTIWTFRRRPYLLVGWLWFLGTLVPVIGIVQISEQSIANRFVYVPTIGIFIMLVWGASDVLGRSRRKAAMAGAITLACVAPCIVLCQENIRYFQDSVTLWRHDVAVAGKYGVAHYALALSLENQGQREEAIHQLQEIAHVKPNWADVQYNLGSMLCKEGRFDEGLEHYYQALKFKTNDLQIHLSIGFALAQKGQLDAAVSQLREAIAVDSHYAPAHDLLGTALYQQGHPEEAVSEFQKAVQLDPGFVHAQKNLAKTLLQLGRLPEALASFEQVLKIDPADAQARANIAVLMQSMQSKVEVPQPVR